MANYTSGPQCNEGQITRSWRQHQWIRYCKPESTLALEMGKLRVKEIVFNIGVTHLLKIKFQKPVISVWVYFNYRVNISKFPGSAGIVWASNCQLGASTGATEPLYYLESLQRSQEQDRNTLLLPDLAHTDLLAHAQKIIWNYGTKNCPVNL